MYFLKIIPAFIFLVTQIFGGSQCYNECIMCQAFTEELISMVKNDEGNPNDLSSRLCLNKENCNHEDAQKYLGYLKAIILKAGINGEDVCTKLQLCNTGQPVVGLQQKFILVLIEMTHVFLNLLRNPNYTWNNCVENYRQVTGPFVKYILENQADIQYAGSTFCKSDFIVAFVQPETCELKVNMAITSLIWNDHSFSLYVCGTSSPHESYNQQKLNEIENATRMENPKKAKKILRDKAKVHEVISDSKEMLSYVVTSDGDINALCTMCTFFIQGYPSYKARFVSKVETIIRGYFYGGLKGPKENNAMRVISLTFYDWLTKFDSIVASEMSACTDDSIKACSTESYNRVSEVMRQFQEKMQKNVWPYSHERTPACESCGSLGGYLAPILQKPAVRKDLTDHLFGSLNKFYSLGLLDNIGISVYPILEKILNYVADFIVEHEHATCLNTVFCKD